MIKIEIDPSPRFDAWAYGYYLTTAPGYSGPSASGWEIRPSGSEVSLIHKALPSRGSNRRVWEAAIMAVVGVLEHLPPGSAVKMRLKDMTLANAIRNRFIRTSGKPMAGLEFWSQLLALLDRKRIVLKVIVSDSPDPVMMRLIGDAELAAALRLQQIGVEQAVSGAIGPKARSGFSFPAIEGYEDKPQPIHRKKKRGPRGGA